MTPYSPNPRKQVPAPESATVAALRGGIIRLKVGDKKGVLMVAGLAREALYDELVVGQQLSVRAMGPGGRPGETNYTCKGLIKSPWQRVGEEFSVGDIVRGRVVKVNDTYALVELLPEAAGLVPFKEIDFDPTGKAKDLLTVGEVVSVRIVELNPGDGRALLSIRQALGKPAKDRIALVPGGRLFPREAGDEGPRTGSANERGTPPIDGAGPATSGDKVLAENRRLSTDLAAARKELKSLRGRLDALTNDSTSDENPARSARDFLRAVRLAYARDFDEEDRMRYPLRRMRVGREFLDRLNKLEGIPIEKVIEVCAQVASGRAKDLPSRKPHRAGEGGSGGAERATDHARAWRCSLQDNSPGARRLHWWDVPGPHGGTVEFASVGHHDDFSVPE